MDSIETEVVLLNPFSKKNGERMCQQDAAMEVVVQLARKGRYFAFESFQEHDNNKGLQERKRLLKMAVPALIALVNTSHDGAKELGKSEFKDVFLTGKASKVLNALGIWRHGWASYIWPKEMIEYSTFRSAIGLAMVAYAVYIKRAIVCKDFSLALIQCADTNRLLSLDQEKKAYVKNKVVKARIEELPRIVLSEKGKKAVSNRSDQQQKAGWKAHCKMVKESGANVATLEDLTNIAGYDPLALKVAPRTLRAWAKEEGIEFKAGRPKK